MLSLAFALVLSQTPIADKVAPTLHLIPAPKPVNCPDNGTVVASNPAINRPYLDVGAGSGFPDMVHMPQVYVVSTVNRMIGGCYTPAVRDVLFAGKKTLANKIIVVPAPAPKP